MKSLRYLSNIIQRKDSKYILYSYICQWNQIKLQIKITLEGYYIILIKIKKSKKKLFFQIFIMNYSAINNKSKKWLQIICIHNKTVQNACNQVQISNPHSMNQFYQIVMRPSITQTLNDLRPQILYTEPLEIVFQQEYLNKFLSLQQQSKIMKNDLEIQQKELKYQQDLITRRIQKSSSEIMRINQVLQQ
ncbi:unnamed protein product [Paramecium pentaurelia]|uniref:Uncharacterized protein n=1 Tax=Paramecium pentaurelia TaxID=43138 RepID=A0A8S1Y7D4_9CILI|nr:unnamed protein product [Paramecium pentaurelia]